MLPGNGDANLWHKHRSEPFQASTPNQRQRLRLRKFSELFDPIPGNNRRSMGHVHLR